MHHWAGGEFTASPYLQCPLPVLCVAEDGTSLLLAPATVPPSLSLIPVALIRATGQRGLEREGSIWLLSPDHCPARREVRAGTQAGQEHKQDRNLEAATEAEATKGCCSLACCPWLTLPALVYTPGPCAQGWNHHPQQAGPSTSSTH